MKRPIYGMVAVGPPGSGKTTFCDGMQQYTRLLGRDTWVVNLDPANERIHHRRYRHHHRRQQQQQQEQEHQNSSLTPEEEGEEGKVLPYETLLDVCQEVVNLTSVMEQTGLGPNGGVVYCMEYLQEHVDDIIQTITERIKEKQAYLIFDLPGQIELYTHSTCVQNMLRRLVQALDLRLTVVQLIDAHYCTDASKFLSAALLGTTTMLRLELPTVNVLSKIDLLTDNNQYFGDRLDFGLEYYTECHDLDRLVPFTDPSNVAAVDTTPTRGASEEEEEEEADCGWADDPDYRRARARRRSSPLSRRFTKLYQGLAEVIGDFGLLHFVPLDIGNAASVGRVLAQIDKANGFVFTDQGTPSTDMFNYCAIQQETDHDVLADVRERIAMDKDVSLQKKTRE